MVRTTVALLAVMLLPSIAQSQRGRDRGTKVDFDEMSRSVPPGPRISAKDIEDMSQLKYFVDKRKDLKLSDDQTSKIKEMDSALKEKNAPLLKSVDSLVKLMKPSTSVQTAEDQARMVIARESLMGVVREIQANYKVAVDEVMPAFDESQTPVAKELLDKHRKEVDETMRSKMGGRGGAPGHGPGRGGRGAS